MARRGKLPKPEALKKIQGNPGKRKRVQAPADAAPDAQPGRGVLAPPKHLSASERVIWEAQIAALDSLKFVRASDARAFARYVKFQALFEAIAPLVSAENAVELTTSDKVTMERVSKRLLVLVHLDKALKGHDEQFGMTPAARQSLLARLAGRAPGLFDQPQGGQEAKPDGGDKPPAEAPAAAPAPRPASPVGFGRLN